MSTNLRTPKSNAPKTTQCPKYERLSEKAEEHRGRAGKRCERRPMSWQRVCRGSRAVLLREGQDACQKKCPPPAQRKRRSKPQHKPPRQRLQRGKTPVPAGAR